MEVLNATLKIFADYMDRELAQHGFTLISPYFAERRAPGMRQGVLLRVDVVANVVCTEVQTYSGFTHELDDGPTAGQPGTLDVVAGVASGGMGSWGGDLRSPLRMVSETLLPDLLLYGTVDAIVAEVEKYPGSASRLIGSSPIAATFNFAHCLETVGRLSDATALYLEIAERLEPSSDPLAQTYADAARRHARAIEHAGTEESTLAKSASETPEAHELELSETDEVLRPFYSGLLQHMRRTRLNPATTHPAPLFRAMDELYEAEPRPGFWRSVSRQTILNVVKTYAPGFEQEMAACSPTELEAYVEDLDLGLYMRKFDELCAERLLALPAAVRPQTREQVYDWLLEDFNRRGEEDESDYLQRDALKGADGVIRRMVRLQAMELILTVERRNALWRRSTTYGRQVRDMKTLLDIV
ncbi:hypothetical protein LJR034_005417 [Caballeronia sp. LjRoot34]|uniref:hypothetical protein n=1 Tax=Caballeronia sp. LjRoot34 TaxID=3342325 RepID=UPI003ECD4CEB